MYAKLYIRASLAFPFVGMLMEKDNVRGVVGARRKTYFGEFGR